MHRVAPALLALLVACSGSSADSSANDTSAAGMRNSRYCEILFASIGPDAVHIDVYSTEGLNSCPDAAWKALDTTALKAAAGADIAVLNGPRYWMLDSLAGSTLQDSAVKAFGGIDMRKAGQIVVPIASVATMSQPYVLHSIHRQSAFHWLAGQPAYELHDASGHAYVMQSYSAQKMPLTIDDLADLGTKLTGLPIGWSYAPRTLANDLNLLAPAGDATVVQDELGNTYSME
jgi:hypothetical protein